MTEQSSTSQPSGLVGFIEAVAERLGIQRPAAPTPTPSTAASVPAELVPFGGRVATYEDWSEYTIVPGVYIVTPERAEDVVAICNASVGKYRVRALGHSHNWSPLTVDPGTPPNPPLVLVDTSKLTGTPTAKVVDGVMQVTFGTGTTLEAATAFLETLDNGDPNAPKGYSFLNMPTPGKLTLGGILAIGGHGTSVPFAGVNEPDLMGCLSNLVVSLEAVTTTPGASGPPTYALRTIDRSDKDSSAFLVHLGRALITQVTLAVVPNYWLELTNLFPSVTEVLGPPGAKPANGQSLTQLLDAYGRVEVIWFPSVVPTSAWVQCSKRLTAAPGPGKPRVSGPYNYPWMTKIPQWASDMLRATLKADPALADELLPFALLDAQTHMMGKTLYGTARELEIYLTDDTLRMTIFGYVVQLPRGRVQEAANQFYAQLHTMLQDYASRSLYPINGAVEIRCTTLDHQGDLGVAKALPPALAATHAVAATDEAGAAIDTVLWVDVLTYPDLVSGGAQFFTELEQWILTTWGNAHPGRVRPEWSKGYAYTPDGPWKDDSIIKALPKVYDRAEDELGFTWAKQTLAGYDAGNLFTSDFLDLLFA